MRVTAASRVGSKRSRKLRSIARSTGFGMHSQTFRLSDSATLTASLQVAASQPLTTTIGAVQPRDRQMMQQLAAGVLAERQIERDAVERGLARQLCGFVVGRRAGRQIAGFGRGAADDHAVQIVVIDDQKPRRAILRRAEADEPFSIQIGRLFDSSSIQCLLAIAGSGAFPSGSPCGAKFDLINCVKLSCDRLQQAQAERCGYPRVNGIE